MRIRFTLKAILIFLGFGQARERTVNKTIGQDGNFSKLKDVIEKGFQIDCPKIFVPWDIDVNTLKDLFKGQNLVNVATGYYTTRCTSFDNLNCMLGFHFEPCLNGRLNELEFFRTDCDNQKKSFDEFQKCFSQSFGQPTNKIKGNEGFYNYEWQINNIQILHFVFDRFGPEENLRIRKVR